MNYGINGLTGKVENVRELGIWDTINVRKQTLKTSVESACMILRIDDIVSGMKKSKRAPEGQAQASPSEQAETVSILNNNTN
jgi:T-complex protein 1 subunit gamma